MIIPNIWENEKIFQTTNQFCMVHGMVHGMVAMAHQIPELLSQARGTTLPPGDHRPGRRDSKMSGQFCLALRHDVSGGLGSKQAMERSGSL